MNLPFSFRQKVKIALLLSCIMACTLLIRVLEDKSIEKMNRTFSSMHNDRLVPAIDLFQISEQVYAKRHLIEGFGTPQIVYFEQSLFRKKLHYFDNKIDSLLLKYEKTFLVSKEKKELRVLKSDLEKIKALELTIITSKNTTVFNYSPYQNVTVRISNLTKIQTSVGGELSENIQKIIAGSKLYSNIQFVLAILIGVLILSILLTANVLRAKTDNFSLN